MDKKHPIENLPKAEFRKNYKDSKRGDLILFQHQLLNFSTDIAA